VNEKILFLGIGIVIGSVVSGFVTGAAYSGQLDDARKQVNELKNSNRKLEDLYRQLDEKHKRFREGIDGIRIDIAGLDSGIGSVEQEIDGIIEFVRCLRKTISGFEE